MKAPDLKVVIDTANAQVFLKECAEIYQRGQRQIEEGRRATDQTNPKDLLGMKKPSLWLNPRAALLWMAKAFEFGGFGTDANGVKVRPKGYGPYNWRDKPVRATVYIAAIERHLASYLDGEDLASDSKVLHLAHIMACAAILIDAKENGNLIDDRPPKGPAARLIEALTLKDPPPTDGWKADLPYVPFIHVGNLPGGPIGLRTGRASGDAQGTIPRAEFAARGPKRNRGGPHQPGRGKAGQQKPRPKSPARRVP